MSDLWPRFSLRQLLIGVAVVATLFSLFSLFTRDTRRVYNEVAYLAYSPDGTKLAIIDFNFRDAGVPGKRYIADVSHTVSLLDVATLGNRRIVHREFRKGNQGPFMGRMWAQAAFSPDGALLGFIELRGGEVRAWDVKSGRLLNSRDAEFQQLTSPRTPRPTTSSSVGKKLRLDRNPVQVWDDTEKQLICTLHQNADVLDRVTSLALSPNGETIAWRCEKGLHLFDFGSEKERNILPEYFEIHRSKKGWGTKGVTGDATIGIAFSPDGKLLAAWGEYGLKFFDMTEGCDLRRSTPSWTRYFAFAPDGKTYATGEGNGTVAIWDVATGREIRSTTLRSGTP